MVSRDYKIMFEFTDELYAKYEAWCKENHLNGYHGVIGGSHHFEITPTNIGNFIDAVAQRPILDENGEPSYNSKGELKTKKIHLTLREPQEE